jgi:hypothetical protein
MRFQLPATKARNREVAAAYALGFADGMRHAENHSFALPDIEPTADDLEQGREANCTEWSDPLDLDPYTPIIPKENP